MKTFYKKILETEFNGKTIFEQLGKNGLTVSKSYKGSEYDNCSEKIMIVGRAMNGWEDEKKYTSVDEFISALFSSDKNAFDTKNVFNDVVNPNGIPNIDNTKKYFYSRSKFWKLIHHILKEYGMANNNWYDNGNGENMNWSPKIVWSNLYKISPYSAGNPEDKLMKLNMNEYINILKAEIAEYKPQKLIFITDKWFIEPDENLPSFKKALEIKFIENPDTCIVGTGQFGGASIVVCTRPDKWGMTNAQIEKMAEEIKDALGE